MKLRELNIILPPDIQGALGIDRDKCIGLIDRDKIKGSFDPLNLEEFDKVACSPANKRTLDGCRIWRKNQFYLDEKHSFLTGCSLRNDSTFVCLLAKHGMNLEKIEEN